MVLFGALLLFTAGAELSGLARRMRFDGAVAWLVGGTSGLLGGFGREPGRIRSAALLGVDLQKHVFVGTATAVGLMVDGARMPVYLWQLHEPMRGVAGWIALATVGVVIGTPARQPAAGTHPGARVPANCGGRTCGAGRGDAGSWNTGAMSDIGNGVREKDVVCGMQVDPARAAATHDHDGKTYYFCGKGCLDRFAADPDAFLRPVRPAEEAVPGATYTCPMHPEVVRDHPDACPICGMALDRAWLRSTRVPTQN